MSSVVDQLDAFIRAGGWIRERDWIESGRYCDSMFHDKVDTIWGRYWRDRPWEQFVPGG